MGKLTGVGWLLNDTRTRPKVVSKLPGNYIPPEIRIKVQGVHSQMPHRGPGEQGSVAIPASKW